MRRITFPDDKATSEWLDSQKNSTRSAYVTYWKYFLEFTELTGDQILADRRKDKEYEWEKKTLEFKTWMMEEKKKAETSATTAAASVRSFFSFHRFPLKFRRGEKKRLTEAEAKYEDYRYSREDLAKMASFSGLKERYVLIVGKSFGLRVGDFIALTRGDLEAYLDREVPISIGKYVTQKGRVPAYPMIDSDALPVIKLMLEDMTRQGRTKPNERMLKYKDSNQLTKIVQRLTKRAGVEIGDKRVRFHCLRKFLTDHLSSYMSESKWKQIVGKKISEGAYVSPDTLREDYKRAMNETTFTKAVSEEDMELLAKKEALKMLAKMQGMTEGEMKKIFQLRKVLTVADQVKVLEELTEENTATNGGCQNGNCQRIVSEEELPSLLAQGWRVSAVLPSGRVVVSNETLP